MIATHLTGDRAHALTLDWYEAAAARNGPRDRRFRIVHAWYPRMQDIVRGGRLGVVGDVTPYHLIREIPAMRRKLHPDQLASAFAWQSMIENGWRLNLVSDWPGSYDGTHPAPLDPLHNMYMATTRKPLDGDADKGWHTGEALTIDQAIAAYTINPAWSEHKEAVKGSITAGKLADLVVLSHDIRAMPREHLLDTHVVHTIFGGRIVYSAEQARGR